MSNIICLIEYKNKRHDPDYSNVYENCHRDHLQYNEIKAELDKCKDKLDRKEQLLKECLELVDMLQAELRQSDDMQTALKKELEFQTIEKDRLASELAFTSQLLTDATENPKDKCVSSRKIEIISVCFEKEITIVQWSDNTYTTIVANNNSTEEKANNLSLAVFKKLAGNDSTYKKIIDKWLREDSNLNSSDASKTRKESASTNNEKNE